MLSSLLSFGFTMAEEIQQRLNVAADSDEAIVPATVTVTGQDDEDPFIPCDACDTSVRFSDYMRHGRTCPALNPRPRGLFGRLGHVGDDFSPPPATELNGNVGHYSRVQSSLASLAARRRRRSRSAAATSDADGVSHEHDSDDHPARRPRQSLHPEQDAGGADGAAEDDSAVEGDGGRMAFRISYRRRLRDAHDDEPEPEPEQGDDDGGRSLTDLFSAADRMISDIAFGSIMARRMGGVQEQRSPSGEQAAEPQVAGRRRVLSLLPMPVLNLGGLEAQQNGGARMSLPGLAAFFTLPGMDDYQLNTLIGELIGNVSVGVSDVDAVTTRMPVDQCPPACVCPICQDSVGGNDNSAEGDVAANMCRKTVCGHYFCDDCISKWLETSKKCPMCMCDLEERASVTQL